VNSDVINLTAENFEAYITVEPLMLIEFSTPKCSHCQVALPYLGEVATTLKERNIKVAKVDCDKEAELCWSNYVQSYPYVDSIICISIGLDIVHSMLKMYKSGTPTYYRGLRKAGRIISYMIKWVSSIHNNGCILIIILKTIPTCRF
jgi:protein disulfide-isomerase A1